MNTSTITATPDQSDTARQAIELGLALDREARSETLARLLALDREARSETLARLIAGSVHEGQGTALERFAATGNLDADAALNELNYLVVPLDQEGWIDALGRFILLARGALL